MLVLLDNARDADQVRPLLPGAGDSDAIARARGFRLLEEEAEALRQRVSQA